MTTIIQSMSCLILVLGAAMYIKALHLIGESRSPGAGGVHSRKRSLLLFGFLALPMVAQAATDLRTAAESGNAIIMYLSGILAAVGIVAAGVAMMMGRQSIAKWAFAGAVICGLAFAIVKVMWSNMGLEAAGVSTFS